MHTNYPEILAPIANFEMCKAAVHNGADAVYAGMPDFNARGRTVDLTIDELKIIIDYCHLYGVKVFLAFNILIFQNELERVCNLIKEVSLLSPDAFIVQDIGLVRLIKKICPTQTIHASTQMTVTNFEAINITSDLGISRYVLGRENSLKEIQKIKENTNKELEVFVHGALCVSYSGQCLTSERIGGRSANRGQCAQSCRLPYDLIVDGKEIDLGPRKYLVSPQDLCSLDNIEELHKIGVNSLKIEGRLKSPEYVASTVKAYKDKLNKITTFSNPGRLETIYSRGFFNGWMDGVNHQKLVPALYSNHHGKEIGKVASIAKDSVTIQSDFNLSSGDGLVFCDFTSATEVGSKVYDLKINQNKKEITVFLDYSFDTALIKKGMLAFCNSSSKLSKEINASYLNKDKLKKIYVSADISGKFDEPVCLKFTDDQDNSVIVYSSSKLEAAKNAALTKDFVANEIAALSGTCFQLTTINYNIDDNLYIHQRELKEIRRQACLALTDKRTFTNNTISINNLNLNTWINDDSFNQKNRIQTTNKPSLNILLRDFLQIDALTDIEPATVYLDFEFGKEYGPAIDKLKNLGHVTGIATTRILKPGETAHLKQIIRLSPDYVLVRNLGALEFLKKSGLKLIGDFSLNITNSLTASWFLEQGLERYCPSYDLNKEQLIDLLQISGGSCCEITIHQYMPAFHMEHCVFAAFLSNGTSYKDCGRPCEKHRVELRDHTGAVHPLKADAECRNTMFHGIAHSSAGLLPKLLDLNVTNFRFEALYETPKELRNKLYYYIKAIKQEISLEELFKELQISEKYGVSEGQLHSIGTYRDRKKTNSTSAKHQGISAA